MASSKEMQQTSRPLTHRPSISSSTSAAGLAPRQSHSRNNSHSILSSSLNANHRVTRRKSMTNTAANVAAVAVAIGEVTEAGDKPTALPISINGRRNTMSKSGISRAILAASLPAAPINGLTGVKSPGLEGKPDAQESAIDDEMSADDGEASQQDGRVRRASDGQPLVKEGGSRKFNRIELRCDQCGKGYKHSSCLSKHLWEHTPEWSFTSKLLISKHQQVQLLEAASVLVTMNNIPTSASTPPDSARDFTSDQDSASPAASGYSDVQDDRSSADTTPPPHMDSMSTTNESYRSMSKRYSGGSGFSRSYQSAPSASSLASSAPNGHAFSYGHFRQLSQDQRPTSSGKNATGQDDQELAAAVELLSCSFGSNSGSRTVHIPSDAPPVPPVPAQYLDHTPGTAQYLDQTAGTSFINSFPRGAPMSFERGKNSSFEGRRGGIKREESGDSVMGDDDDDLRSRARSDEDDEGVFGRMEE